MSDLLDFTETTIPEADALALGFQKETNQGFQNMLNEAYDAVDRFWYRNKDKDGNGVLEPVEGGTNVPTGPEILTAMKINAQKVMAAAGLRKQMLIELATNLGKTELIDMDRLDAPFQLEFNADGSLKSATLKS